MNKEQETFTEDNIEKPKKKIDWKSKKDYLHSKISYLKKPMLIIIILLTLLNLFLAFFEIEQIEEVQHKIVKVGAMNGFTRIDKVQILHSDCVDAKITKPHSFNEIWIERTGGEKGYCYIRYIGETYIWRRK